MCLIASSGGGAGVTIRWSHKKPNRIKGVRAFLALTGGPVSEIVSILEYAHNQAIFFKLISAFKSVDDVYRDRCGVAVLSLMRSCKPLDAIKGMSIWRANGIV